jgi:hypothetical protein
MQPPNQGPVTIDAVMGLLRDGALRRFRVDIEADSTITGDESQERQDRTEFIQAVTEAVTAWEPVLIQAPQMMTMFGDLLLFGVRGFRVGRELEETIEDTMDKMEEMANSPKPPAPPDPKMQIAQVQLESEKVKSQAEIEKQRLAINHAIVEHQTNMDAMQADMRAKAIAHQEAAQKAQADTQGAFQQLGEGLSQHQQALAQQAKAIEQLSAVSQAIQQKLEQLQQGQQAQTNDNSAMAEAVMGMGKQLAEAMSRPRKVVRGPDGSIVGSE